MNDLLGAVKVETVQQPADIELAATGHTEKQVASADRDDTAMNQFYSQVADVKRLLSAVQKNLKRLQKQHEESKVVARADQMKEIQSSMEEEITETAQLAKQSKDALDVLDSENTANRVKKGCGEGTSHDRTRQAITNSLKKKLRDLLGEFNVLRTQIQEEYRDVVSRHYSAINGTKADEETLDQIIETGESEQLFTKAIQDIGRGRVLDTVAEIQERHTAILSIERGMVELHQIFLDMSVLVDAQGEMLDNIESQVGKAVEYVGAGNVALTDAKALQKSTRKWMCCAVIILLSLICIIVVAVIKPWETGDA
ncbi:hypothetical protein CYMTET_28132 [Cymbomonas tetramitiformis]|uniref:t-SNARE coiled-coil homology domain-containing protein n=1 Tax=Cymbomonas tetramitiformis TaxID=36881 RepID=A0AAE0FNH2_9CHLO|nr:hypothetical protein CYMTET_28132 [Cymbomonas tetramitiformis]